MTNVAVSSSHRAQIQTGFPRSEQWLAEGEFARFALWPRSGNADSFRKEEWTAYYRASSSWGPASDDSSPAYFQILVCRGELTLVDPSAAEHTLSAGTFFSGVLSAALLAKAPRSVDCLLIVKRTGVMPQRPELRFRIRDRYDFLPNLGSDGVVDAYGSAYVLGNPLKAGPGSTALVRFPAGAIVSSHYHPAPIFHEFIYLSGGHLTPDGFYAPGDHVTSLPGCKEGPWLACHHPDPADYPADWPRYTDGSLLFPSRPETMPFESPWRDERRDIIGLLFVHGGPFVLESGELNWHKLAADELGLKG